MKIKLLKHITAMLLLLSSLMISCEEKEDTEGKASSEEKTEEKIPLVDENGNAAKINVSVFDYENVQIPVTDENGFFVKDDNDQIIYETIETTKPLTGKTVYMFDEEDVTDKSMALKKAITDIQSTAVFELPEDYFKEDNPIYYFAVFDGDKIIAQGGLAVKKGKETAMVITTKNFSSGALYYYNLVKRYKLNSIAEEYKMNVKARINLANDNITKMRIDLPENTVAWYFSFNCVEKSGNNAALGFFPALLKFFDPTKGLASDVLEKIIQPKGSVDCNVYLEDEYENRLCTKITHLTEGKVEEKQYINGTYYLVFENPYVWRGISVNLDVVAETIEK